MKIGIHIKQLRYEKGMTFEKFATSIGCKERTLRRWESGERLPSIKYIKIIVDKYDIEDVYFFIFGDKPRDINKCIPKLVYLK